MKMEGSRRKGNGWIVLSLLFPLLFTSCGPKDEDIIARIPGTYYPLSCVSPEGEEYEIEDEVLHFDEGGKGYFVLHDNRYEIRWEFKNGVLSFEDSTGDFSHGVFRDGIIEGDYFDDIHYVFSLMHKK